MKAFPVIIRIFKSVYEELFLCVAVSLLWWVGVLLIVPAGPVTLGLHSVANRAANYRRTSLDFFWAEARAHPGRSWGMLGLLLLVAALISSNIYFYGLNQAGWARVVTVAWLWVALFYLLMAQYLFPLFCQQSDRRIRTAARNAALLAVRSPIYSLVALLFQLLLIGLCLALFLPALLLMPALIALSSNFFLTGLLQEMGMADAPPAAPLRGE